MKTLILYASKYGCAEDCAGHLKNRLNAETDMLNLKAIDKIDLQEYDWIVIGGSIYVGKIQKEVKHFCEQQLETLLTKNIGLFICCSTPNDVTDYFKRNFPARLLSQAAVKANFGGELRQQKMGFIDRKLTAIISKAETPQNEILYQNIDALAAVVSNFD